jgi:rubrerythrin
MAIIIGAVLAILSAAVVIYPFLKFRSWGRTEATPEASDWEGPDLEAIFEAIRTLQLDHQLGKVPEGLYQEQLRAYRFQAAAALKQQAETQARDADWALEQEIQVARASMSHQNGSAPRCPNCGTAVSAGLGQCPECNVELPLDQSDARETQE